LFHLAMGAFLRVRLHHGAVKNQWQEQVQMSTTEGLG
jgi:hypothetical protein